MAIMRLISSECIEPYVKSEKEDSRKYDFLLEENITYDLFKGISGYKKVLLAMYATGGYSLKDLANITGTSTTAVNHNIHDTSITLRNRIKDKFQGKLLPEEFAEESVKSRRLDLDLTLEGIGGRNPSHHYTTVIEPQILAVAVEKGYIKPAEDKEFQWLKEHHHSELNKKRITKKLDSIASETDKYFADTPIKDLPEYLSFRESLEKLKSKLLE